MATRNKPIVKMYTTLEQNEAEREEVKKEIAELLEPIKPLRKRLRKLTNDIAYSRWYIKNKESKGKS